MLHYFFNSGATLKTKLFLCFIVFFGNIALANDVKRIGDEAYLSMKDKIEKLFPKKTKINENCEIEVTGIDDDNFKIKLKQKKNTIEMTFERDQVLAPARIEHPALEAFLDHTEIYYPETGESAGYIHHDTQRSDGHIQRGSLGITDSKSPYPTLKNNIHISFGIQYVVKNDGRFAAGPTFHCSMNGHLKDYGINTEF